MRFEHNSGIIEVLDRRVAEKIRERRQELGLTPAALDKKLSRRSGTIRAFESSTRFADILDLGNLSVALGVPLEYFFEGEGIAEEQFFKQHVTTETPGPESIEEMTLFLEYYYRLKDDKLRQMFLNLVRVSGESASYGGNGIENSHDEFSGGSLDKITAHE